MSYLIFGIVLAVGVIVGFIVANILKNKTLADETVVEAELNQLECAECDIEHLIEEWKVTIQTQMHFNDLIIKFRSIVLTVIIAISTLSIGLYKQFGFSSEILLYILIGVFAFWICCFLLDFGYYHQLLIGSIKHAEKFDRNDFFKKKGLLGLTNRISLQVKHLNTNIIILTIYLIPMILMLILIIWKVPIEN